MSAAKMLVPENQKQGAGPHTSRSETMAKVEENRRAKTGGRAKGTPNKTTGMLKDAIMKAAELSGQDGKGKGKVVGYLQRLADNEPKAFAGLLGRVLPLQVTGGDGGPVVVEITRFANPAS